MFVYDGKARALKRSGRWHRGVYTVQPWGVGDGYLVVLQGAGGGCWYPSKDDAERAAARQNAELREVGVQWLHMNGGSDAALP